MNNFAQARGLHDSGGTATQRRAGRKATSSLCRLPARPYKGAINFGLSRVAVPPPESVKFYHQKIEKNGGLVIILKHKKGGPP
jgi:hypothetical protein